MKLHLRLSLIVLTFALAGCYASKGDFHVLESDVEELKTRNFRLEKDLVVIRTNVKEELGKSGKVIQEDLAKVLKDQDGLQKDMESQRKESADFQANLDSTKVDLRVAAGKIDDMAQQVKKPGDDIALLREDIERRFAAIDERLKKLEKANDDAVKKVKEAEQSPEPLYQKGLGILKKGEPQQAREIFTKFIELYPGHELAANARYWIGETYYSEKNYEQAILEFQQLLKDFPGKEKVPAALLKQGMAFKELGDQKSARFVFDKLLEEFPSAVEAKQARVKLKELK